MLGHVHFNEQNVHSRCGTPIIYNIIQFQAFSTWWFLNSYSLADFSYPAEYGVGLYIYEYFLLYKLYSVKDNSISISISLFRSRCPISKRLVSPESAQCPLSDQGCAQKIQDGCLKRAHPNRALLQKSCRGLQRTSIWLQRSCRVLQKSSMGLQRSCRGLISRAVECRGHTGGPAYTQFF